MRFGGLGKPISSESDSSSKAPPIDRSRSLETSGWRFSDPLFCVRGAAFAPPSSCRRCTAIRGGSYRTSTTPESNDCLSCGSWERSSDILRPERALWAELHSRVARKWWPTLGDTRRHKYQALISMRWCAIHVASWTRSTRNLCIMKVQDSPGIQAILMPDLRSPGWLL